MNWDPTELPIVLLGSVFDASSLSKWIFDWTIHNHGASSPMAGVAGSLLIKLVGKMCGPHPEHQQQRDGGELPRQQGIIFNFETPCIFTSDCNRDNLLCSVGLEIHLSICLLLVLYQTAVEVCTNCTFT